jgi:hypothetical protein
MTGTPEGPANPVISRLIGCILAHLLVGFLVARMRIPWVLVGDHDSPGTIRERLWHPVARRRAGYPDSRGDPHQLFISANDRVYALYP